MRENHDDDDFATRGAAEQQRENRAGAGFFLSYREDADGVDAEPVCLCVPHDGRCARVNNLLSIEKVGIREKRCGCARREDNEC